jgi:thermitase
LLCAFRNNLKTKFSQDIFTEGKVMKSIVQGCTIIAALAVFSCADGEKSASRPACLNSVMDNTSSRAPQGVENSTKLIVKMKNLVQDFENFRADLATHDKVEIYGVNGSTLLIEIPLQSPARQILEKYISENKIEYVEPDYQNFIAEPDSPYENEQLSEALDEISDDSALATEKEIVVAVIDSGVDYNHKDLAPYMWANSKEIAGNKVDDDKNGYVDDVRGWDFANNDNDPMADDTRAYHGTHVAGIVKTASRAAELGIKIRIMALKYLDSVGTGRSANSVRALDYATRNGAHIINTSWGSFNFSQALFDAIERARKADVLLVAAAGNGDMYGNGINIDVQAFYPAAYNHSNIISVAAHNQLFKLTNWSNFGKARADLAAPGSLIRSTRNGNTYGILSGTSMASPYIAGVAGLLRSVRPDLNYLEIKDVILKSSIKSSAFTDKMVTGGRVSRTQALSLSRTYNHQPGDPIVPDFTPLECPSLDPQG